MRSSSAGTLLMFIIVVVGFVIIALDLRHKQRQIDALKARVEPTETAAGGGRLALHERRAIAALRNLVSSQALLRAAIKIDEDNDQNGEYGGLQELSGRVAGRMEERLRHTGGGFGIPDFPAFTWSSGSGVGRLSGYCYRVFLTGRDGILIAEPASGFTGGQTDVPATEQSWCAYAWPMEYGVTGVRTFFTDQRGEVLHVDAPEYTGPTAGPAGRAAYAPTGTPGASADTSRQGNDGKLWKAVDD